MFNKALLPALVAASIMSALTGCTAPVDDSSDDLITAAGKTLPFSYDTVVDQVTHMSCSNMPMSNPLPYNGSAYFTFRVGAYTQGGITLKDSFYTSLKRYTFEKQREILAASPQNRDTVLQLSLRGENRQSIKVRSGTSAVAGQDYANMFAPLGDDDVSQVLVNNPSGGRVRHLRTGSAGGSPIEGSLYFTQSASSVQEARDFAQGISNSSGVVGTLAVTYTNGSAFSARSAADAGTAAATSINRNAVVYGRSYRPTFVQPTPNASNPNAPGPTYPRNVLGSISETSLDGAALSPAPSWSCPVSLQFKIVRAEDIGLPGANCVRKADPSPVMGLLKTVRNTLKVEDWYVDLEHQCIIPKRVTTGCYGPVTSIRYSMGDTCGLVDSNGNSNCVQFASTCFRN